MAKLSYIVFKQDSGWFVSFENASYGPFPSGRTGALIAAVQSAYQAGKDGHDACVRLRVARRVQTIWTFGQDPYPPPWTEAVRGSLPPERHTSWPGL